MDEWGKIKDVEEWYDFVDSKNCHFHFKSGNFFNFEFPENFKQLGIFFSEIMPFPPTNKSSIDCPLGKLQRRSLLLDPAFLYAPIVDFVRQGDLIELQKACTIFPGLETAQVVVAAHTCDIENKPFSAVLPAYTKSEFFELERKRVEDSASLYTNIKNNFLIHFFPYVPVESAIEETLVIDLRQIVSLESSSIKTAKRIASLSLQGSLYFQNRLSLSQVRDLKGRDDCRSKR